MDPDGLSPRDKDNDGTEDSQEYSQNAPPKVHSIEGHRVELQVGSSGGGLSRSGGPSFVRLRHFTNNKGADGIMQSGVIKASDKNSVFAVTAKGKPGSARDVESALGIRPGRGNNYIEFNAKPSEFRTVKNPKTGTTEKVFKGNVNLKGRDAKRHKNR